MTYTLSHLYAGNNIYPTLISSQYMTWWLNPLFAFPQRVSAPTGEVQGKLGLIELFLHHDLQSRAVKAKGLLVFVFLIEEKDLVRLLKNDLRQSYYVLSVVNVSKKISSAFAPITLDSLMLKYVRTEKSMW